jgi:anti-sigma factor RsiW
MSDREEELLGYLLGALDDAEQEAIERRLKADEQLRAHLARACRNLQPLYHCDDEFEPPPGLADRTCRLITQQVQRSRVDAAHRRAAGAASLERRAGSPPRWWRRLQRPNLLFAALVLLATGIFVISGFPRAPFAEQPPVGQGNLSSVGVAVADSLPATVERRAPSAPLPATLVSEVSRPNSPRHSDRSHAVRTRRVLFEDGHVVFLNAAKDHRQTEDRFIGDLGLVAAGPNADDAMVTFSDASSAQQLGSGRP